LGGKRKQTLPRGRKFTGTEKRLALKKVSGGKGSAARISRAGKRFSGGKKKGKEKAPRENSYGAKRPQSRGFEKHDLLIDEGKKKKGSRVITEGGGGGKGEGLICRGGVVYHGCGPARAVSKTDSLQ